MYIWYKSPLGYAQFVMTRFKNILFNTYRNSTYLFVILICFAFKASKEIPDFRSITLKLEIIQLFYIGIQTYYANPPGRG